MIIGSLAITLTASASTVDTPITFTAGLPANVQVDHYQWTWDDGTASYGTTGPQTQHTFSTRGQKTVRVDVFGVTGGQIATQTLVMNIS